MCGPEDLFFTPLLQLARVPFQAKESVHKTPFWENFEILASSLNFCPNFSSQAPKFGNFQLISPQIGKFSVHKLPNWEIFSSQTPLFRGKYLFVGPTLQKSGPHTPNWKKLSAPRGAYAPCMYHSGVWKIPLFSWFPLFWKKKIVSKFQLFLLFSAYLWHFTLIPQCFSLYLHFACHTSDHWKCRPVE